MLPYELWLEGKPRRYLVCASDTQEARRLLKEHLNLKDVSPGDIKCTYADKDEMGKREVLNLSGWIAKKESHLDAFKRCKKKKEAKVIADYLY